MKRALDLAAALTIMISCVSAQSASEWVLVAGDGGGVNGRTWDQIVGFYPAGLFTGVVDVDESRRDRSTHRFLVGAPVAHPLIAQLAPALGITVGDDALSWHGQTIPQGTGLALVVDDADGIGMLAIYTGVDDASVWSCFTVSIDLTRHGATIAREGQVVSRRSALLIDASRPSVTRLDIDWNNLVEQADREGHTASERALRIARGLVGHGAAFEAALGPRVDLPRFVAERVDADDVDAARKSAARRDLTAAIHALHDRTVRALGSPTTARPNYTTLYGALAGHGTNARTFGHDAVTGRPAIVLNLCALDDEVRFDVAVVHETVHAYQPTRPTPRTLVDRAVAEGVAMLVSEELCPEARDEHIFMADVDTLRTARAMRSDLTRGLRDLAASTDPDVHARWLQTDRSPSTIDGAPPRSGYIVGWLAARAWLDAQPERTLADLLVAEPTDVLAAL